MAEKKTTTTHGSIAEAAVAAIAEIGTIAKDKTAKVPTKGGGQYSYQYADLATIMNEIRPILAAHGLALVQQPKVTTNDDRTWCGVVTRLVHTSGEEYASELLLPVPHPVDRDGVTHPPGAQACGSAITYARRYSLSIVGVCTEEDDDGAAAQPAVGQGGAPSNGGGGRQFPGPSEKQIKRYWLKVKDATNGDRDMAEELHSQAKVKCGFDSITTATREQYDAACEFADSWPPIEAPTNDEGPADDEDIPF